MTTYYSQFGQDRYLDETIFKAKREGVFIDIGAYNGIDFNNTYFFEKERGWKGVCVEPLPPIFKQLQQNRKANAIEGCIAPEKGEKQLLHVKGPSEMLSGILENYHPLHFERIMREIIDYEGSLEPLQVPCFTFNEAFENYPTIDLLSVDTEGGEFEIVSSIDFQKFQIEVVVVENNYDDTRFIPFFTEKGFTHVHSMEQDLIFVRK